MGKVVVLLRIELHHYWKTNNHVLACI